MSVPRSTGDLPQHFDHLAHPRPIGDDEHPDSYAPLYEFGHGLSYTEFAYDGLSVPTTPASAEGEVDIAVEVTNVGDRRGTETVRAFARRETSSRVQPTEKLVGFDRVAVDPGESATVPLSLPAEHFDFYKPRTGHVVEPGTYRVRIGDLRASFEMTGEE